MAQVIDASVAVAWFARAQADAFTDALLIETENNGGHVPAQFRFEVVHSLMRLRRRGTFDQLDLDGFVLALCSLPLEVDAAYDATGMVKLYDFARRYNLKIYDAAYLELALRTGLPLATRDNALARAAEKAGAILFKH